MGSAPARSPDPGPGPHRKQLTWNSGRHNLRASAQLDPERSDDEIVADELDGEDVAVLAAESWRAVESRAVELLSVTETASPDGARRWLDDRGIVWLRPHTLTHHLQRIERPART